MHFIASLSVGLVQEFCSAIDDRPEGMSDAVVAIKVLLEMIKRSEGIGTPYALVSAYYKYCTCVLYLITYSMQSKWALN